MSIVFRPIRSEEHELALELWDLAFTPGRDYFERYYRDDPWYEEGDTLGAFEGERLVSAVHVCRRPVEWAGRTLRCGAVANVATHPDYRRRGLSRALLRAMLERMEATGLDFSMLFTGAFGHYAALGWEQVVTPRAVVALDREIESDAELKVEAAAFGEGAELYWKTPPRPLLLHRPERYFRGWVGWEWSQRRARLIWQEDAGYAAVALPEARDGRATVLEWFAMDEAAEPALLAAAAAMARAEGYGRLALAATPYYGGPAALQGLGGVTPEPEPHMMLRNLRLSAGEFEEVKRLYASGDAAWWPSDAF